MVRRKIRKSAIDLYHDLDQIKASIAAITSDVKSKAKEMLSNSYENAKDRTIDVSDDVEEFISERPYQTIGTALLVGVVLGFLLGHKE